MKKLIIIPVLFMLFSCNRKEETYSITIDDFAQFDTGDDIADFLEYEINTGGAKTIEMPENEYRLSRPVQINEAVHIIGSVGWRESATVLKCDSGCFQINHRTVLEAGDGRGTTIENLKLQGQNQRKGVGIKTNAKTVLKNIWLQSFVTGVHIEAEARKGNGNSNNGLYVRVYPFYCDTSFIVRGNDANNNVFIN